MIHPTPAHLKDQKPRTAFFLRFGMKLWYIYEVVIRDNPYIDYREGEEVELVYIDEIKPVIGNSQKLRSHHPYIVGITDTFKTMEKAERNLIKRVWEKGPRSVYN